MIIPDANLLLYAYDAASPFHARAAAWWSRCLSGTEPVGLTHPVLFAFVRIGTNPRAFVHPLPIETAANHVRNWLRQPGVVVLETNRDDVDRALDLLCDAGTGGNLTTDAQIAAIALRHRAVIHTADSDYARFPEVRWENPLLACSG